MSGSILTPLLEHAMPGGRLRYFKSPHQTAYNAADMPWHSADDFLALAGTTSGQAEEIRRAIRRDWAEPVTCATKEGITVLLPHFMAEGYIAFLLENPAIMRTEDAIALRAGYRRGMTECLKLLTAHLNPFEKLAFSLAAMEYASMNSPEDSGGHQE